LLFGEFKKHIFLVYPVEGGVPLKILANNLCVLSENTLFSAQNKILKPRLCWCLVKTAIRPAPFPTDSEFHAHLYRCVVLTTPVDLAFTPLTDIHQIVE
jgi:hypothetical protein